MQGHGPETRQPLLMSTSFRVCYKGRGQESLAGNQDPATQQARLWHLAPQLASTLWPFLQESTSSLHPEVLGPNCQPKDSPCPPLHRLPGQTVSSQASALCNVVYTHSWLHGTCLPRCHLCGCVQGASVPCTLCQPLEPAG